jgi:hypothetical protein
MGTGQRGIGNRHAAQFERRYAYRCYEHAGHLLMTAHAAFYKHPNGRVVQVHTAAEATTYQRRGYTVTTWDVWYAYYLTTIAPVQDTQAAQDGEGE